MCNAFTIDEKERKEDETEKNFEIVQDKRCVG